MEENADMGGDGDAQPALASRRIVPPENSPTDSTDVQRSAGE